MVNFNEFLVRIRDFVRFEKSELTSIVPIIVVLAFVFSFRDWGVEQFDFAYGLRNFFIMLIIVTMAIFFRLFCQKAFAVKEGFIATFKAWWPGLIIALFVAFLTKGRVPLAIAGGISLTFMTRQRLGEFRYFLKYDDYSYAAFWGPLGNLILALLFGIGFFFLPNNYFFYNGLVFNLIMAICQMLPLPQLDGLNTFYGLRGLYYLGIGLILLAPVLLLTRTALGLTIAIVLAVVITIVMLATGYDK